MSSDSDRKRGRTEEEETSEGEGGKALRSRLGKRARPDEEGTSSERELALHASDEDIFSLNSIVTTKGIPMLFHEKRARARTNRFSSVFSN